MQSKSCSVLQQSYHSSINNLFMKISHRAAYPPTAKSKAKCSSWFSTVLLHLTSLETQCFAKNRHKLK